MGFFRRESLHERLAREGGLVESQPRAAWDEVGIHGIARPREADVVVVADAPEVEGSRVDFTVIEDGTVIVDEATGDQSLGALADAVEQLLARPYRAQGVRQTDSLWAVSARKIQVASFDAPGDRIELTQTDEGKTFVVDGERSFGTVRALEELGESVGDHYAVQAERLDADLWEVRIAVL